MLSSLRQLLGMLARLASRARPVGILRVPRVPPTRVARAMSSGGGLGDVPSLAAAAEDEALGRSGDVLWQVRGIESHLPEPMWQAVSRVNMSQAELNQLELQEKIKRWQRFEGDTGSSEVVVGVLSARIAQHTRHMEKEPKDTQAKRRLTMLLSHRNRVLKYLRRNNRQTYERVLEVEGIRKTGMFDPAYRKRPTKRPTKRGLVEARKRAQKKVVKLAKAQEKKRKKKRPS